MPPSGFHEDHTGPLGEFLSRCYRSLAEEVQPGESPQIALSREINVISRDLQREERTPAARATLELVRAFYLNMLGNMPRSSRAGSTRSDFSAAAARALGEITGEVLAIHIDEQHRSDENRIKDAALAAQAAGVGIE